MQTIAISSFKGGTAKTSISLNLGACLAHFHGKKVLLIDFDSQANLTAGLGFDPDNHDSLAAALQDNKKPEELILKTSEPNLDLIPADTWLERVELTGVLASDRYSHEKLKRLLAPLDYDIAIIDTPPSLCWLTESALIAGNYALICATPEFYSVKGLQRLSFFMHYIAERHPFELLGIVLSFWSERGKANQSFLEVIDETFPEKLLKSRIRRDIAVSEASIHGKPVFAIRPKSRAAEDYQALTEEIFSKMSSRFTLESSCLNSTPS